MQTLNVTLNKIFEPVNNSKKRYRVLKGSAGSGKSANIAIDTILRYSDPKNKGRNMLCIRKVDGSNRNSTFAELQKAVNNIFKDKASAVWQVRQSPLLLRSKVTGNEIIFRGVKDDGQREKVKSITFPHGPLTDIWCEEATELQQDDIEILDDRLRGKLPDGLFYQMTLTFNPVNANHWIKRVYFDNPSEDVLLHHSTYLDNAFCDEGFYKRQERRKLIDPEGYRIYGLGEWGELGGLILTHYKVDDFEVALHKFDAMAFGQDFGFNDANAILLLGWKDSTVYVCDEIYLNEKDTDEIMQEASKKFGQYKHLWMWCDCAEPDRIKTIRKLGWNAFPSKKYSGSVNAQIDWLKSHQLVIHPNCQNLIKELQQWRWELNRTTNQLSDKPIEVMDHAIAALRYGVESWRDDNEVKPAIRFF